ncbi:MAG: hypothetical protein EBU49_07910 [Proteobacteria bacterium]|nr:hypothetical protein [Pseudomonadota bacterium]
MFRAIPLLEVFFVKEYIADLGIAAQLEQASSRGRKLFERLGGRPTLDRVHKIFYEKLYAHSWIGKYFEGINRELITNQQSDFMGMLFGGPKIFSGRMPIDAHMHMMISEELFDRQPQSYRDSVLPPEAYFDLMVISTGTRRMWPLKNVGPLTDEYSMTSDWGDQWLTGGLEPDVIAEAHFDAKSIENGITRFAKDHDSRLTRQRDALKA